MKKCVGFVLVFFWVFSCPRGFCDLSLEGLGLPQDLFPPRSEFYTIQSVREMRGHPGSLIFRVHANHAEYEPQGLASLRKNLSEIIVIEQLDRGEGGNGFADGAVGAVKDTGRGLKNLVVHPIESGKGIGEAAGKLGGKISDIFRTKEEGEKTTIGEKILGSTKRKVAKELGVDVYSRNPYLQDKLTGLAKARMGGEGAVKVAQFFLPIAAVASIVVTASGINNAADQLINDCDRADLYEQNKNALLGLGFDDRTSIRLLDFPYYTPREMTYLRFYLESLRRVGGYRDIVAAVLKAGSEFEAQKILQESQIAADSVKDDGSDKRLQVVDGGIALQKGDDLIFITAYDYLDVSDLGTQVIGKALYFKQAFSKKSLQIFNSGIVTNGFRAMAMLKGIGTKGLLLFGAGKEKSSRSREDGS